MRLKLLASWLVANVLAGVAVSAIASCNLSETPTIDPSIQDTPPPTVPMPLADKTIQLWNLQASQLLASLKNFQEACAAAFSPDGKLLAGSPSKKEAAGGNPEGTI